MRVDDFIVLGRTAPEDSKKYGQSICMAGYSQEMKQFMRIYPMGIKSKVKTRNMIVAEIERNKNDSRIESWTLKSRSEESIVSTTSPLSKHLIRPLLENNLSQSISELNNKKLSLGVIKPKEFHIYLKPRPKIKDPYQLRLFDNLQASVQHGIKTANKFFYAPYVGLKDEKGQSCLQIREWGVYELMRKYEKEGKQYTAETITGSLHIKEGRDVYFVVGNMANVRNIWLIIKSFVFDREHQVGMMF